MSESHKQELSCYQSHILVSGYGNRRDPDPIRNIHAQIRLAAPTDIHTISWEKTCPRAPGRVGRWREEQRRARVDQHSFAPGWELEANLSRGRDGPAVIQVSEDGDQRIYRR